ncbi:hypothetical protein [Noviherbaspirillum cavernae]|uniref:hypothetical protein n=1 Tax=Noviherbaspirillum cavernae TaxID=2320862 RepID=UPI0011C3D78F|nr:hypothetical protein [Noviherbaspirillum cavernae]
MKKLLTMLAVILVAGCSSMGMGSMSGPSGVHSSGMGMGTGSIDTDPTPYIQRDFNPNDPYHGG